MNQISFYFHDGFLRTCFHTCRKDFFPSHSPGFGTGGCQIEGSAWVSTSAQRLLREACNIRGAHFFPPTPYSRATYIVPNRLKLCDSDSNHPIYSGPRQAYKCGPTHEVQELGSYNLNNCSAILPSSVRIMLQRPLRFSSPPMLTRRNYQNVRTGTGMPLVFNGVYETNISQL